MAKLILGFTGPMASGKEVSRRYLEEKYAAKSFRFSTALRDVMNRLNIEINRENIVNISTCLRGAFGDDLLAKAMANDVSNTEAEIVVVDGIRRPADIAYLTPLPGFHLIAIDAEVKIRHARLVKRNENIGDADKTLETFILDHKRLETEASIPSVMSGATLTINNDGSLEDLHRQLDTIITDLLALNSK